MNNKDFKLDCITSTVFTRDLLEKEILAWLRNEDLEEEDINE